MILTKSEIENTLKELLRHPEIEWVEFIVQLPYRGRYDRGSGCGFADRPYCVNALR